MTKDKPRGDAERKDRNSAVRPEPGVAQPLGVQPPASGRDDGDTKDKQKAGTSSPEHAHNEAHLLDKTAR